MSEDPAEKRPSRPWRLPLMILWGLSPAIAFSLGGLFMGKPYLDALGGSLFVVGLYVGPVAMLLWSGRLLWWTPWNMTVRLLLVIPLGLVACTVNFFIAVGACAVIQPDIGFH